MINRGILFWVFAAILTGIGLFLVKYNEQQLEDRLAGLNRQIVENQRSTQVLRVEVSHLGDLNRMERLNDKYLRLQPIAPRQIGTIEQFPLRRQDGQVVTTNTGTAGNDAPSTTDAPSASATARRVAANQGAGTAMPAPPMPAPGRGRDAIAEPVTAGVTEDDESAAPPPPTPPAARRPGGGR